MGSGGCGKSHLLKTVFHAVSKVFLYRRGDSAKPRVLLIEPKGVAAININGNAVHSVLHIPCRSKLLSLNDANKAELRNKYSEVELVVIDEISMFSSKLFYQTREGLNEIISPGQDIPFVGKSVLVCENLCQLPAVRAKPVLTFNDTETVEAFTSMDLWCIFRLPELEQVMRQDDKVFLDMLNKIRVGEIDQNVEDAIKSRFIDKNDPRYPGTILYIVTENAAVERHNNNQLKHIPAQLITTPAKGEVPKNSNISDIKEEQSLRRSINQWTNGKQIEIKESKLKTKYLKLDDKFAGQIRMSRNDVIAKNNKWASVKRE